MKTFVCFILFLLSTILLQKETTKWTYSIWIGTRILRRAGKIVYKKELKFLSYNKDSGMRFSSEKKRPSKLLLQDNYNVLVVLLFTKKKLRNTW